jgi:hypothetical protein
LGLLTDDLNLITLWAEIEQHINSLLEGISTSGSQAPQFRESVANDSSSAAIAELLAIHLDHSCLAVSRAAQSVCAKLLINEDSDMQEVLIKFLQRSEGYQERILMVLDAVSFRSPDALTAFQEAISGLGSSPNWSIRRSVREISMRCGWTVPSFRQKPISLPSIYNLSLPPRPLIVSGQNQRVTMRESILDSADPVRVVSPFHIDIGIVAKAARIPELNMLYRVVEFMEQLSPRETWSAEAEQRLRSNMDSVGIRLVFTRPRARIARRAMHHAIRELLDAGQLTEEGIDSLEAVLRTYDPQMVSAEPSPRPIGISPFSGLTRYSGANEEWLEHLDGAVESIAWRPDGGRIVLAEETQLKHLGGWESPMEVRQSVIHPSHIAFPPDVDAEEFFSRTVNGLVDEYPTLHSNSKEPSVVVRNREHYAFLTARG